jgi:type I restriction enzyme S subunit
MSEWKEYKLGEIAEIIPGFAFKSKEFGKIGELVIKIKDINPPYIILSAMERVDTSSYPKDKLGKYKLAKGDFVVAMTGATIGKVGKLKTDVLAYINQRVAKIKAKNCVCNDFIYYSISTEQFQAFIRNNIDSNTAQENISAISIGKFPILLPPLPEQKAIAAILSSLDDKIDLLHRQNSTLEKMAETLFRQCFIEEAKEEWEIGKLADEFDFIMGASPPGESYNKEGIGIPMYQGNADFGFRFPVNRVFTTDPKRFAEKYDTLISVRAPVGEQNMADERCCIGRGVAAFRFKKENSFYTYTYFKMKFLMDEIKQFNETGTVFGSISKSDFENIETIIPDKASILKFQNEAKPIDDKIITNTFQIRTLSALRDTLLPKLMSGEVTVQE